MKIGKEKEEKNVIIFIVPTEKGEKNNGYIRKQRNQSIKANS